MSFCFNKNFKLETLKQQVTTLPVDQISSIKDLQRDNTRYIM